jgi:hypothetical protein
MELAEAVGVVQQVCANFQGTLAQHQQIQVALKVITDALPDVSANGQEPRLDVKQG